MDFQTYKKVFTSKLEILKYAQSTQKNNMWKRRKKFALLNEHGKSTGKGFLFSTQPPTGWLPSDPKGILKELRLSIAEFEAGNESMRQRIVPLWKAAKRLGVLPKALEKKVLRRGFTWIYS